jgi:hypothetical protein
VRRTHVDGSINRNVSILLHASQHGDRLLRSEDWRDAHRG